MLPKELVQIFEEYDEDDYDLFVTKADNASDNFLIEFTLNVPDINDKGAIVQEWRIEVFEYRKSHIDFGFASFIHIKDDHPLLWEFTDTQCELYFNGQCQEPSKLFYDLYVTHEQAFDKYQCFNVSFGESWTFYKPFQYSNGLLTEGSKKLMLKYAECLQKNGLGYNIIGERAPKYWDGDQYVPESQDLKVLLLGNTYIVAKSFHFTRK